MQQVVGFIALWTAVAAEAAIFGFVIYFTVRYCIPWQDIREKRAIRARLLARIPEHRERLRRLDAGARHVVMRYRSSWARKLAADITKDSSRIIGACASLVDAIERNLGHWPREAAQIDRDLDATIGCVERMLALRDRRIPEIVRLRAEVAREAIDGLSTVRDGLAARIEECAGAGCNVAYERRCVSMLSSAFVAYRAAAEDDPDAVFALRDRWRDRLFDIALSAELRMAVAGRVAEAAETVPQRASRIRQLLVRARPFVVHIATRSKPGTLIGRIAAIASAESAIESAENHLRAAQALAAEAGTDVERDGASARRLKEALLSAERADQHLAMLEEDLIVASTAFDAATSSDPKRGN